MTRRRLVAAAFAAVVVSASSAGAQVLAPVYFTIVPDAVTGDNTPVQVNHPAATCGTGTNRCYIPDPNPSAGADWVDNHTLDVFERPMGQGSSAKNYLPWIDITSSAVGFDANYLYYRIDLYGTNGGNLPSFYSFEINFDSDAKGDILVRVEDPTAKVGTNWGTSGLIVYNDTNQNIGGPRPLLPDGPSNTSGGYETLVFDQGSNNVAGAPGGNTAVRARISPIDPTIVELAVKRVFLAALNGGSSVLKAAFRPYAAKGSVSQNQFHLHDEYTRSSSGSPYPWLRIAGAPASCPASLAAENALTTAQRDALDAGTNVQTVYFNPCYPASSIYEFDNGGTVQSLASGGGIQFDVDLAVTKTASINPVVVTGTFSYTVTVSNQNSGSGQATNVVVTDTLPAGTGFVSATPSQGSCAQASGVVTCPLGSLANATSATISIFVTAPAAAGTITNTVSVAGNETDPDTADNSFSLQTAVFVPPPLTVIKSSQAYSDPQNGTVNPKAIPGGVVSYTITVSNPNTYVVDTDTVAIVDATPANLQFGVADLAAGVGPVIFQQGAPPSGLTYSYVGLASGSDDIEFSNDGGASWSYSPAVNPNGVDPNVTHVRIRPKGGMAAGSSFNLVVRYRVQ